MSEIFYALAVLACPVGMGAMMWMMMRGQGNKDQGDNAGGGEQQQVQQLRAEIDQLKAERAARRTEGTH